MSGFLSGLRELTKYRSAVLGLFIIGIFVVVAVYAVIRVPYSEAKRLWRSGEEVWRENPVNALPAWVNIFPGVNLPPNIVVDSRKDENVQKRILSQSATLRKAEIVLPFEFSYDGFPKELTVHFFAKYKRTKPFVIFHWHTPDGRVFDFGNVQISQDQWYGISLDKNLIASLGRVPERGLFADPHNPERPLKGEYKLVIEAYLFEDDADIDSRLIIYGQVHGIAGTDHLRRDISLGLLWGIPIALIFGALAALGTMVSTLIIAAIGSWFGGWVDGLIQRLTEIRMVLPILPILLMIGVFYSSSIWVMLGAIILLSIVSGAIKTYRAVFLQEKNAPYIEAARSYGAGSLRIIFRYLVPRVIPWLVPGFVLAIPDMVFLEAALAVLGLGDPVLPTLGKVLNDAFTNGALYHGYYYWVVEPSVILIAMGFSFSMVGFALDRIFNPRLREI